MKNKFDKIIDGIHEEYCSACKKHPHWPDDIIHAVAIMAEESGESIRAALNYVYEEQPINELKQELVQTAAMCIRCLINIKE